MIQTLFGSVEQEPTLLERLKSGVEKTRAGLVSRLEDAIAGKKENDATRDVLALAHHCGAKGWIPATSGNFSVRIDAERAAITASAMFARVSA